MMRVKLVDNPSDHKAEFYDVETGRKRLGKSPLDLQTQFLKQLHADGYEPFDTDKDGYQLWRKANRGSAPDPGRDQLKQG
jgi:hypothetical protein